MCSDKAGGQPGGYMGKILRADLTAGRFSEERPDAATLRKYVGGTGLGVKYLYEEVTPQVSWDSPDNRLMLFAGPLSGTSVFASGTINAVTKSATTGFAGTSQGNGFFAAFLKFSGFDGVILQGAAPKWSYLYLHDNTAELRDASHLLGKDCWETEDIIKAEIGQACSVISIGPAGENRVRFAALVADRTHVMSKNGMGAVMGSKRLKAVVAVRGKQAVPVKDPARLKDLLAAGRKTLAEYQGAHPLSWRHLNSGGSAWHFDVLGKLGLLPTKNCTTNIFPEVDQFKGENVRARFPTKPTPCWACPITHVRTLQIVDGPYKGYSGGEPEFEEFAAMGPQIGVTDPAASIVLANLVDRLGLDVNEAAWAIGWVMECYEAGLLKKSDLDGLEMTWGNVDAVRTLLGRIARREGFGDILAEGIKRAAERVGGEAVRRGVWIGTGATIRAIDGRSGWPHLVDQTFAQTGTSEVGAGTYPVAHEFGFPPVKNAYTQFDPEQVSTNQAKLNGIRQWQDCAGVCIFAHQSGFQLDVDCLNAITGWDTTAAEAIATGRRAVNMLCLFNLKNGLRKEIQVPSERLGAAPVDGPAAGVSIMPHLDDIRSNYFKNMGWDESGRPLPETLTSLGLGHLLPDLEKLRQGAG
ncbi:MAG: hypothetical protein HYX96_04020 [Chloroflexi bacterium]|nr:hypothetical protein [Chloroflexota bacterium]